MISPIYPSSTNQQLRMTRILMLTESCIITAPSSSTNELAKTKYNIGINSTCNWCLSPVSICKFRRLTQHDMALGYLYWKTLLSLLLLLRFPYHWSPMPFSVVVAFLDVTPSWKKHSWFSTKSAYSWKSSFIRSKGLPIEMCNVWQLPSWSLEDGSNSLQCLLGNNVERESKESETCAFVS